MSISELCQNVAGITAGLKLTRDEAFDRLAISVADEAELDPASVADELEVIGRTAEELSSAAQLILDRRAWIIQLNAETSLLVEHNKLAEQDRLASLKHSNDLLLLRSAREAEVQEISQALQRIDSLRSDAQTARNKLIETHPDYQQLQKLWTTHGQLSQAIQERLPRELRQSDDGGASRASDALTKATIERDRVAAEIARIERGALQ